MTCALSCSGAGAADYERERRLGDEMALNLFDGEVVTLNAAGRDFLAAWIAADDPKGTVIVLHGRGVHPDWQDVAGPVRVALADHGFSTLSLQMPVLANGATYYDYVPTFDEAASRIDAGVSFAREKSGGPFVLFAHSCGAHMAMHRIRAQRDADFDAFVFAGLGATDYGQDLLEPYPLDRIGVPVLDILGTLEYPRVLAMADARWDWIAAGAHPASRQIRIEGADHFFKGRNGELARAVAEWLSGLAAP